VSLPDDMTWRYAVKRFAPGERAEEALSEALEAARLAPSSFGLQPYRVVRVGDPALREAVLAHAYGQSKVVEAGHLLVFARRDPLTEGDVEAHVARTVAARGFDAAAGAKLRDNLLNNVLRRHDAAGLASWCRAQTYLALGVFLAAAARLRLDACPMEGFSPSKVSEALGLPARRLRAEALVTAGVRAEDDAAADAPKVRLTPSDFLIDLTDES